jgi:hypothetical protein
MEARSKLPRDGTPFVPRTALIVPLNSQSDALSIWVTVVLRSLQPPIFGTTLSESSGLLGAR